MTSRGVGYLAIEPRGGHEQYWITIALEKEWTAVYRVAFQGEGDARRARIGELRIVPGTGAEFTPSRDYAMWETRRAARPDSARMAPFSFEAVHRGISARRFRDALTVAMLALDSDEDWGDPVPTVGAPPSRRGRPASRPRTFYATFALRYDRIENKLKQRRELGESTREKLAREYKQPVTTIGKWIHLARRYGYLTPGVRGRRGGRATPLAHQHALTKGSQ